MAITLNYVTLKNFKDVMPVREQAEATDDDVASNPNPAAGGGEDPDRDRKLVKRFLRRAESLADGYLINYERPISNPPMALKYAVYVIARYFLLERGDGTVSEDIQNSYDQAINWLESVRNGEIDLEPAQEEFLEDFVGFASLSEMEFGEYPFVDKSATKRAEPL